MALTGILLFPTAVLATTSAAPGDSTATQEVIVSAQLEAAAQSEAATQSGTSTQGESSAQSGTSAQEENSAQTESSTQSADTASPSNDAASTTGQEETPEINLFGDEDVKTEGAVDPAFTHKVELRRSMLQKHQLMGLTTLGLMVATSIVGGLNYQDIYGADPAGTGRYIWPHRVLAYTTTLSFGTTASLSLLAPKGYKKHKGFDTATAHKIAVSGATLGMLTQIGLGFVAARTQEAGNPADMKEVAKIHEISGIATTGFMAIAATVWIF